MNFEGGIAEAKTVGLDDPFHRSRCGVNSCRIRQVDVEPAVFQPGTIDLGQFLVKIDTFGAEA